jgi:hypothetical protein
LSHTTKTAEIILIATVFEKCTRYRLTLRHVNVHDQLVINGNLLCYGGGGSYGDTLTSELMIDRKRHIVVVAGNL